MGSKDVFDGIVRNAVRVAEYPCYRCDGDDKECGECDGAGKIAPDLTDANVCAGVLSGTIASMARAKAIGDFGLVNDLVDLSMEYLMVGVANYVEEYPDKAEEMLKKAREPEPEPPAIKLSGALTPKELAELGIDGD